MFQKDSAFVSIRVNSWLESAADGDHLAVRLIIIPEIVLLRLAIDHIDEKPAQLVIARARAQRFHDIELEITAETRPQFSIASQAKFVAAFAKVEVRHRPDESDPLFAAGDLVIGRRAICSK
jgi:hypothetical protein